MVRDRGTWCAAVHEVARIGHDLATEQQQIQVTTGKRGERKRVINHVDCMSPSYNMMKMALYLLSYFFLKPTTPV